MEEKEKELLHNIGKICIKCATEILLYTPLLYSIKNDIPDLSSLKEVTNEGNATGILFTFKEEYFLITAGHVFENTNVKKMGFLIDSHIYFLDGILIYTRTEKDEISNSIDISVLKLSEDLANSLKTKYKFLSFDKIDFDHVVGDKPNYLIVGYPLKQIKYEKVNRKVILDPLIFITGKANAEKYKRWKINSDINILLHYKQKKVRNFSNLLIQSNSSPIGISGCGVWYLSELKEINGVLPTYELIGFINEQTEDKHFLIATRIHIITEIFREKFGLNIPKSNIATLK